MIPAPFRRPEPDLWTCGRPLVCRRMEFEQRREGASRWPVPNLTLISVRRPLFASGRHSAMNVSLRLPICSSMAPSMNAFGSTWPGRGPCGTCMKFTLRHNPITGVRLICRPRRRTRTAAGLSLERVPDPNMPMAAHQLKSEHRPVHNSRLPPYSRPEERPALERAGKRLLCGATIGSVMPSDPIHPRSPPAMKYPSRTGVGT